MNKILLVKMPRYYESYFEENSESLALGYLSAYLRKFSYEVILFDASLEKLRLDDTKKSILQIIRNHNVMMVGFTIADMTFIESTIEAIEFLRENDVCCHITMGGHAPTFNFKEILQMCPGLDSIIRFEGEIALLNLVEAIGNHENWQTCQNISYRDNAGHIFFNPPLPLVANLDELPFPSRDYLPYVLDNLGETGVVTIAASRGCYMNCGFCSIRNFYDPPEGYVWRTRSIEDIISEITIIKKEIPLINEIVIVDDIFTGPSESRLQRMLKLREELEKNNLRLMFSVSERVNTIDEEIVKLWKHIGVRQVLLGLESASQEILGKLNKKITLEDHKRALDLLDIYGIDSTVSFINFTPWSTLEQIQQNVLYFLQFKLNILQGLLNRFQVYDGTPLAEELEAEGIVYGVFPNKRYKSLDSRVDKLYEVIENSFNPYLFIAYRLKTIERKLRIILFDAETNSNKESIVWIMQYKIMYRNMMQKIMEEAVYEFLYVLELIKSGTDIDQHILDDIKEKVLLKSNEWYRMTAVFESLCPALNS